MKAEQIEMLLKLKAYISANFLNLADTKDHSGGCDTCGYGSTIDGTEGMTMEKISDVIERFIKRDGIL